MTRLARLQRLERLSTDWRVPAAAERVGIHDELTRDDGGRLDAFLQACERAGLLENRPDPFDDSQLAEFLRAVWDTGLVAATEAGFVRVEDPDLNSSREVQ